MTLDPLTTVTNVQLLLGVPVGSPDPNIAYLINAASALITHSCNRPFWLASNPDNPLTELYSGTGEQELILRYHPVQYINSIHLDDAGFWNQPVGAFPASTLLTSGTDYALEQDNTDGSSTSAIVYRLNSVWDSQWSRPGGQLATLVANGRGNIKVVYTYGFNTIPADLDFAAALTVIRMLYDGTSGGRGIKSTRLDVLARTYMDDVNPKFGLLGGEVANLIAKYRIVPVSI